MKYLEQNRLRLL